MNYNIYLHVSSGAFNLLDISEDQMSKVLTSYLKGDSKIALSGKTFYFGTNVSVFKIFENSSGHSKEKLEKLAIANGAEGGFIGISLI